MRIVFDKNNKNKIETSKKVIFSVIVLTYIFVVFACYMIYKTEDLSPFTYLIPSIFGLATTSLGFYSWKAKKENELKLEIEKAKQEIKLNKKLNIDFKEIEEDENYGSN